MTASTKSLCRSAADLAMLMTDTPQGRYPYAGIPWYSTTFGRDGLITALQMLWWSPEVARGVLRRLAYLSGQDHRSARRCAARKNSARDARRRNGGAARSAVRPLLRQRRFDTAVRAARRPLRRTHRRLRDHRRTVAGHRSGLGLDRRARRSGSTTVSSNICAPPIKASPIKAGKTCTTRSSTPMAAWPRARSRSSKCKAMSMPPSAWRRDARGGSA